jgi:hypothetical protein
MPLSVETMLSLLLLCILSMALLAAFYLRQRRLSVGAYLLWGSLLIFLPLLGPFLVILARPGARGGEETGRVAGKQGNK